MNRVVAVIVTYNRKNLLIKCIKSIMQQSSGTPDVLIIDNASTDGTKEVLDELYSSDSRVKYMNTGSNLGGAGGFSYGINVAVNLGYDYLWVMDDDTLPENTALEELLKAARLLNDDFGFLSSFVKWTDGSPCVMNIPSLSPFWSEGNIQKQFENHMIRVESASFVSMFIRSEIVRHVGLPIKEFFIWADDIEYALRITKRYKSYYVFDSQVVHAIRNNIPASIIEEDNIERLKRYKLLFRNKRYIARQNGLRARLSYRYEIIQTIISVVNKSNSVKLKKIWIVIVGSLWGIIFRPKLEFVHVISNSEKDA